MPRYSVLYSRGTILYGKWRGIGSQGNQASLGQFELKQGKSFVVLNDRSPKEEEKEKDKPHFPSQTMTVADAVKWVKVKAGK